MAIHIIIPGSHPMHRLDVVETSISTDRHRFLINLTLHMELEIVALGSNQRLLLCKPRYRQHHFSGTVSLHAWSRNSWLLEHYRCRVTLTFGGPNVIWRYRRSELRPSHSDSTNIDEGKKENVRYVMFPHPSRECSRISNWRRWSKCDLEIP